MKGTKKATVGRRNESGTFVEPILRDARGFTVKNFGQRQFIEQRIALCALGLVIAAATTASPAKPQTDSGATIRVTTNDVLVPVFVSDEKKIEALDHLKPDEVRKLLVARNFQMWTDTSVNDLTVANFHLFQDGAEQKVLSARIEPAFFSEVRDNARQHVEFISPGGGKWSYPDERDPQNHFVFSNPHYIIAYSPPSSEYGSCHAIEVNVDRPGTTVASRNEYCNTTFSADDPLSGTEIGKDIESELPSASNGKIKFSMAASALFHAGSSRRVHVIMDIPAKGEDLLAKDNNKEPTIGVLLMAYAKDGSVVARRGDMETFEAKVHAPPTVPVRYESDFHLEPGTYRLQAFLSDGTNFGEAEAPLTVPASDGKHLAVSDIALARRYRDLKADPEGADAQSAGGYSGLVGNGIEITPTAETSFERGEPFHYYFEIYEPQAGSGISVSAHIRIVEAKTGAVRKERAAEDVTPFMVAGNPVICVEGGDEIGDLKKGAYRIEVQATDSGGRSTDWHAASFTVE